MLGKDSPIPLYYQLAEKLREKIKDGEWAINTLIPSETELCKQYEISRGTVRQAISELIKSNLVYKNQGKGTFIAKPGLVRPVSTFYRPHKETEKNEVEPTRKMIENTIIFPDDLIRKNMNLTEVTKVYKIIFIVFFNQEPVALEVSHLIEKLFPQLEKQNLTNIALYETLMREYQIKIPRVRETFEPILINESDSEKLNVPINSLGVLVKRTAWTSDRIFEFRTTIIPKDKCQYSVELT